MQTSKFKVVALVGKSGAGKDYLMKQMAEENNLIRVSGTVNDTIYAKGDTCLLINPFDTYHLFRIYNNWNIVPILQLLIHSFFSLFNCIFIFIFKYFFSDQIKLNYKTLNIKNFIEI